MEFEHRKVGFLPEQVKAKWSAPVLDEGFIPFPKRLLRCLPEVFHGNQGLGELRVVLATVDYRRPNLSRLPSIRFLAFMAGMTSAEFKRHLDSLVQRGLATVEGPDDLINIELHGLLRRIAELTDADSSDSSKKKGAPPSDEEGAPM